MAHLQIVVKCESCHHSYRSELPAEKRRQTTAARSNANIWAQTHRDVAGHGRFEFVETVSEYKIFGQSNQIPLSEDPLYSEFTLGSTGT